MPGEPWLAERQCELETGLARLTDLQQRAADRVDIADAEIVLVHAVDGQILAHRAGDEARREIGKSGRPVGIARRWIGVDRFFGAAMDRQISLVIAIEPEAPALIGPDTALLMNALGTRSGPSGAIRPTRSEAMRTVTGSGRPE